MRTATTLALLAGIAIFTSAADGLAEKARPAKGKAPAVELVTSLGTIQLELYPAKAPKTVENFLAYVKSGFFNGTVFHRVIADFMIQGGGFDTAYKKKATRGAVKNEADNGLRNERGTIAMARTGDPHSATAQFFINVKDNGALNHRNKEDGWGYCVFGKVTKGLETVDKIRNVRTGAKGDFEGDAPQTDVVIKKARLL